MSEGFVTDTQKLRYFKDQLNRELKVKHPNQSWQVVDRLMLIFKSLKEEDAIIVLAIINNPKSRIGRKFNQQLNEKQKENLRYILKDKYINSINDIEAIKILETVSQFRNNENVPDKLSILNWSEVGLLEYPTDRKKKYEPLLDELIKNSKVLTYDEWDKEEKRNITELRSSSSLIENRRRQLLNLPQDELDFRFFLEKTNEKRGVSSKGIVEKPKMVSNHVPPLLKSRCYKRRITIINQRKWFLDKGGGRIPTNSEQVIEELADDLMKGKNSSPIKEIKKWMATCVLSRTKQIHRENELIDENESLKRIFKEKLRENNGRLISGLNGKSSHFDLFMKPTWVPLGYNEKLKKVEFKVSKIEFTTQEDSFKKNLKKVDLPKINEQKKLPNEHSDFLIPAVFYCYHLIRKEKDSPTKKWIYCQFNHILEEDLKGYNYHDDYITPPILPEPEKGANIPMDASIYEYLKDCMKEENRTGQDKLHRKYFKTQLVKNYLNVMGTTYAIDPRTDRVIELIEGGNKKAQNDVIGELYQIKDYWIDGLINVGGQRYSLVTGEEFIEVKYVKRKMRSLPLYQDRILDRNCDEEFFENLRKARHKYKMIKH